MADVSDLGVYGVGDTIIRLVGLSVSRYFSVPAEKLIN